MSTKTKQLTLFGTPVIAIAPKIIPKTSNNLKRAEWFPEDYWNSLTDIERHIHIIAHKELGSSYTVESTQSYIKWSNLKTRP